MDAKVIRLAGVGGFVRDLTTGNIHKVLARRLVPGPRIGDSRYEYILEGFLDGQWVNAACFEPSRPENMNGPATERLTVEDILENILEIHQERGKTRDSPGGERSMFATVGIFKAWTGIELTEEQGWKFMQCLKMARMSSGKFHLDDYLDLVGYAALLAECAANNQLEKANG